MDLKFNLSGLSNIYNEAIRRGEPTLVFELINGNGRFLFMMFFDSEDESTKDQLYIFLRRTRKMLPLKLYGNHSKGTFDLFIKESHKYYILEELQLNSNKSGIAFNFEKFFENLNNNIPVVLKLQQTINILRESWDVVKNELPQDVVKEADKTILIGDKKLPVGWKPKEKTLRKLYLYANGNSDEITKLIEILKKINHTVCWTKDITTTNRKVSSILQDIC